MNYSEFNQYCENLTSTTYVQQWGNCHVWKVGGKVFAIGGWEKKREPARFSMPSQETFWLRKRESLVHPEGMRTCLK